MKTYKLTKRFQDFPEGYVFNDNEAKHDADKKVYVLSCPGVRLYGGNTVEFPEAIVEVKE